MPELTPKERTKIPRQDMPNQDPVARGKNYDEVALGYALNSANKSKLQQETAAEERAQLALARKADSPEFKEGE